MASGNGIDDAERVQNRQKVVSRDIEIPFADLAFIRGRRNGSAAAPTQFVEDAKGIERLNLAITIRVVVDYGVLKPTIILKFDPCRAARR